ncbi:hypothetical protein B0J13DRAFT_534187 [Dactylonectria estremocensis]|uniref:Uncharacterized protein n=1 Tax=Dactylonectria estremocensis TaxID=1079267 RepID=A0A9P9D3G3_9HYPO|nr:hypothetical protein B0J13DRAFT_534187 [Dactylonectria estremocensis]
MPTGNYFGGRLSIPPGLGSPTYRYTGAHNAFRDSPVTLRPIPLPLCPSTLRMGQVRPEHCTSSVGQGSEPGWCVPSHAGRISISMAGSHLEPEIVQRPTSTAPETRPGPELQYKPGPRARCPRVLPASVPGTIAALALGPSRSRVGTWRRPNFAPTGSKNSLCRPWVPLSQARTWQ